MVVSKQRDLIRYEKISNLNVNNYASDDTKIGVDKPRFVPYPDPFTLPSLNESVSPSHLPSMPASVVENETCNVCCSIMMYYMLCYTIIIFYSL